MKLTETQQILMQDLKWVEAKCHRGDWLQFFPSERNSVNGLVSRGLVRICGIYKIKLTPTGRAALERKP